MMKKQPTKPIARVLKKQKLLLMLLLFMGSMYVDAQCVSGACNPNAYVNSSDPNTIEYDNMVSTYHSTIVKESNGTFKIWGQQTAANGTGDQLSPVTIAPSAIAANNYAYTGTPLKATGANYTPGAANHQHALLTTDGLYIWGTTDILISSAIKSTTTFGKITVNGKADGLPAGVLPQQVKMLFGSYGTLGIVTCSGDAWVLSFTGNKNGDGTAQNATNNVIWHRVKTSTTEELNNVVAMRGNPNALFALTSDSKLYTWGTGTYINSGAATNRTYATEVSKPSGITPKMIGMTSTNPSTDQTYYLLATNGKLYTMGNNTNRQLGDGTTTTRTTWVQPQKMTNQSGQGTGPLENIAWISPAEHHQMVIAGFINVLTNNNKLWAWGYNAGSGYGGAADGGTYDPIYMPGSSTAVNRMNVTDEIIAVESSGHTTINIKKGSTQYGYVGHRTNGSMGDGSSANEFINVYSYSTAAIELCATNIGPSVKDLVICQGTTASLNNANSEANPSQVEWHATNDASSAVMTNITAVAPGTYYAFYTVASGKSRTMGSSVTVTGVPCCATGNCNPNSFVNSSDPNTIEYDNYVSAVTSNIAKLSDGNFKAWGSSTKPDGFDYWTTPTTITPANGYNYTGTPLKVAAGSSYLNADGSYHRQYALLTTDGLYLWGSTSRLVTTAIKNTLPFSKITVDGKADGLPPGVLPGQVKMLFGAYGTMALTTCNGDAWVLSFNGNKNGDGTVQNAANNIIWHRVKTADAGNPNLANVVAMRGNSNALFALTSNGELYTWGTNTYLGDGSAVANRTYATKMTVPAGISPKMIGMTEQSATYQSYYLLATDGRLFALGENGNRQLGDGTTTSKTNWVQPQKITDQNGQGIGVLNNIAYISPQEHATASSFPMSAINVLTNDNKLWSWGGNHDYMIGGASTSAKDPTYMSGNSTNANGLAVTDQVIAVETGAHETFIWKKGESRFGIVGWMSVNMGNGTVNNTSTPTYSFNTAVLEVCGADVDPKEGYIYITKKALDENSSVDFNFTVNGGPVTAFTLNDKETKVDLSDLGSSENGRLWAVAGNGTLYYRNAGSSDWVQTTVTTATKVDGAAGNDCYFTNTAGQVLRYDGVAVPTVIGSPANYGTLNATDVGSAWNTTPYIMTSNNTIWIYSGSGTAWSQVGTTTNNLKGVDADPSNGDAIVTDGTIVYRLTSAGVKTSLGAPPGYVDDIAVTSVGEVFATSQVGHVRKWNTGTTWGAPETTSRLLAGRITAGHKDQAWGTNPVYSSLRSIYTRMVAGTTATWLDDERVRTTNKGNTIMIKVPVGTYTVKEAATSGWELQSMDVYDPTSNSTSNFANKSVTLNVALNETVYAVFTNGLVNTFAMGNDCSIVFFEDFGSDAAGTVGPPLAGQTSYHYATGSNFAQDGYYKVAANAGQFWGGANAAPYDHTSGDGTGRMMTINASYDKGIFFRRKFTNLVPGKSYKFSAWLMSLSDDAIKPNATFQVIDPTSGAVLNQVSSGNITVHNVWNEYSMNFVPTSTELDLVLLNNAPGGNGNDIALDDIRFEMNRPQGLTATRDCNASTLTVTAPLGAIYEYSIDNVNWQASPSFTGVASTVTNYYVRYADALACVSSAAVPSCFCYKPGATTGGSTLDTKIGITALGRAGTTDTDNWPMTRKGGWLALESKTKGFVPNRVAFSGGNPIGIATADFVEGMMVYDTTNKCLKMYTLKDGDSAMAWHCITTQTCPD